MAALGALAGPAAATTAPTAPTWSELSPPTSPPGLRGAASAYDPLNGTVVVFGGITASGAYSAATWIWNGSTWTQAVARLGSVPAARAFASLAFDGDVDEPQLILYGGETATGQLLDDTWSWNGSSWYPVPTATSPGGRYGAALGADSAGHLVLFGGYGQTDTTAVATDPEPTTTPPSSGSTTATSTGRSTTSTTRPPATTTTTAPPAPTTSTTTPAATTTTAPPAATTTTTLPAPTTTVAASAAAAARPARATETALVRSAATAGPHVLADTWLLEQSDGGDDWVRAAASGPPALIGASLSAGPDDQTVLFGGSTVRPGTAAAVAAVNSTWIWTGSGWDATQVAHPPMARADAAVGYDPSLGGIVLFGGLGPYGVLDDTWRWNGATWLRLTAGTPPAARRSAAAAFDVAGDELLVLGGTGRRGVTLSDTVLLSSHRPTTISVGPPAGSTSSTTARSTPTARAHPVTATTLPAERATQVRRGNVITLTGAGFVPHAAIVITFHSTVTVVGRTEADAIGRFEANVTVPEQAAPGTHHFEATGLGPDGPTAQVTPVDVVGTATGHALSDAQQLVLVGVALAVPLVAWFALGGALRLRRRTRSLA